MKIKTVIAALLSLAAFGARAEADFTYGASVENIADWTFDYQTPAAQTHGPFSSNGTLTARSGNVSGSINATANPFTGMFKSTATVSMTGDQHVNNASGYAVMQMRDTLSFSSVAGGTVHVEFLMNYDTVFAGLGFAPFPRVGQIDHSQGMRSERSLTLSYDIANPNYDPNAQCIDYGSDGVFCPPETQQTITIEQTAGKAVYREYSLGGPNGVHAYGDEGNGRHTGLVTLSADLPTNTEIRLNYFVSNVASCYHMADCQLSSDASHSDYLGLQLGQGGSFNSSSGYQYLGMAAAVPEPGTWATLLGGLFAIGLLINRRRKA